MNHADFYPNRALENWEDLLRRIHDNAVRSVDFTDRREGYFAFGNELLMRLMRERLLQAFQTAWIHPNGWHSASFGIKFFAPMNKQQKRSFFRRIFAIRVHFICLTVPGGATEKPFFTIHMSALLQVLPALNVSVTQLHIRNINLRDQSCIEVLSKSILAKRETLQRVNLVDIHCLIDYNKRGGDGSVGFLDRLLYASSCVRQLSGLYVSAQTPPSHSSLASPEAVCALFGEERRFKFLGLRGFGLNDSHCHVIAEALRTGHTFVGKLDLDSNPAISAQGYGALHGLVNRFDVIGSFVLDDKRWEAELNLLSEMNHHCGRLDYMTDGAFTSEESRWQWLFKLATTELMEETGEEELAARHVNYIWYTLLENPEFVQT